MSGKIWLAILLIIAGLLSCKKDMIGPETSDSSSSSSSSSSASSSSAQLPSLTIISNQHYTDLPAEAIRLEYKTNYLITDCTFSNVGIIARLFGCHQIVIQNCHAEDMVYTGIDIREGSSGITIASNFLRGFRSDIQGGHFIQLQLNPAVTHRDIRVIGNTIIAPELSWISGELTGASGDMIAMRSVTGFEVIGNNLYGGGEFGLTLIYGANNGLVYGNYISRIDGTGILAGYNITNIAIVSNAIIECGMSYETDGSINDITHQSGIHCRNEAHNITIASNILDRGIAPEMRYGLHFRETTCLLSTNWASGVDKYYHIPESLTNTVTITNL